MFIVELNLYSLCQQCWFFGFSVGDGLFVCVFDKVASSRVQLIKNDPYDESNERCFQFVAGVTWIYGWN